MKRAAKKFALEEDWKTPVYNQRNFFLPGFNQCEQKLVYVD